MAMYPSTIRSQDNAMQVLAYHGKSFYFAGKFLSEQSLRDCACLYRFCRYADDLVDSAHDQRSADTAVEQIRTDLCRRQSKIPVVSDFIRLVTLYELDINVVDQLLQGLQSDLGQVDIKNDRELKSYSYRVAGTVGILMCGILGVTSKKALAHAIDLGIAMQLTNIARDVIEDANRQRRYLPIAWAGLVTPADLMAPTPRVNKRVRGAVRRLLEEADRYYQSGWQGLHYLPLRARIAIAVAARVYHAIGTRLRKRQYDIWQERVRVSLPHKLLLAMQALIGLGWEMVFNKRLPHRPELHQHLQGLPHTDAPAADVYSD